MGILIKGDFRTKLTSKLSKYRSKDKTPEYQKEIFSELFSKFPQFKAHVAAYIERNYCGVVINDEDHSNRLVFITRDIKKSYIEEFFKIIGENEIKTRR